ncbi:peptidylprolyl isomerase [Treponema phagedenis]|uniref:Peptidyl-prolyl cis-trans isomerase n=1 Tax=Treponema phagedenis TaxID=162 RepID=A0A0B7GZK9_TREPH|nr:peptidylprolyl isomerase [Treponema phagedenis]EFW37654.1 peptidyl-prolyl cis-trans isomerase, FKBP-type [Treponema phagedenis F0421]NVP24462.1 peptidylprolyl isomerase [Treponema phagedenis]QEJ95481.1 peptidylprolyl isomerase [Treponema phagedenis]QEJ97778.1 peptidylprolyl isomerase [Treponema phagedenis]QEK01334.1 peptidylprolyl isomerase [Treponema phagedenis]
MKITKDCVVNIEYTLKDEAGEILDSSAVMGPLEYVQGYGMLIPGLEKVMEGKEPGDSFDITVPPAEAYGEIAEGLKLEVDRSQFPPDVEIEVGMQFDAGSGHESRLVTVTDIDGDKIFIDANHPLAGETLHFDIEVLSVREASEEDLASILYGGGCDCGDHDHDCSTGCGSCCGCH